MNALSMLSGTKRNLLTLLSLGMCSLLTPFSEASAQSTPKGEPLKIFATAHMSSAPLLIAAEEGYFAQEGVEIEFLVTTQTQRGLPALVNGDTDAQVGGLYPGFFNSISRGATLRLVAAIHSPSPTECISIAIVANTELLKSGKLRTAKDLRGKRVAFERSAWSQFFFDLFLEKAGMSIEEFEVIDAPAVTRMAALQDGQMDVTILAEPNLSQATESGKVSIWVPLYDIVPNTQLTYVMFGPTLLEQNPELGNKFMVAFLRGVEQYYRGKTPRNIEILAKATGLTPEFLAKACWPPFAKDGRIHPEYLKNFQSWGVERKLVDKELPVSTLWDGRFVEHANNVLQARKKQQK